MERQRRHRDNAPYTLSLVPESDAGPHLAPGDALAEFVRTSREALGLTQQDASRRAGVSKTTWQQIEGGRGAGARNLTLRAMATALDVDAAILLDLRDGNIELADAHMYARPRQEVLDSIRRGCEQLRLVDLYAIEEYVMVRADLRRLQRTTDPATGVRQAE